MVTQFFARTRVFAFFLMSFLVAGAQELKPLRDLAIFVDTTEGESGAVKMEFKIALCQQAAPIMVSVHTLSLFKAPFLEHMLSTCLIYTHHNMCLIIPQSYIKRFFKDYYRDDRVTTDMLLLGFNINSLDNMTPQVLTKKIAGYKQSSEAISITPSDIYAFFNSPDDILWNIYLVGHGLYPHIKESESAQTTLPDQYSVSVPNKMAFQFDLAKYDALIAGFSVKEIRELLTYFNKVGTNFVFVRSCYAGGFNSLLFYNATLIESPLPSGTSTPIKTVAGIQKPSYTFVIGNTTDSGTYTEYEPTAQCVLTRENINSGYVNIGAFFYLLNEHRLKHLQKNGIMSSSVPFRYADDELRAIIKQLTPAPDRALDPFGLLNLPQVMFPNTGQFVFFPLDPDTSVVISHVQIEVAQRTKTPIKIEPRTPTVQKQKSAADRAKLLQEKKYEEAKKIAAGEKVSPEFLFLPIANIPVEIQIFTETIPQFISLLPGIGLHTIKSIDVTKSPRGNISDFIRSFPTMLTAFPKYFYIQKLVLVNDLNRMFKVKGEWPYFASKVICTDVIIAVKEEEFAMMCTVDNKVFFVAYRPLDPTTNRTISQDDDITQIEKLSDDPLKNAVMNYKKGREYKRVGSIIMRDLLKLLDLEDKVDVKK